MWWCQCCQKSVSRELIADIVWWELCLSCSQSPNFSPLGDCGATCLGKSIPWSTEAMFRGWWWPNTQLYVGFSPIYIEFCHCQVISQWLKTRPAVWCEEYHCHLALRLCVSLDLIYRAAGGLRFYCQFSVRWKAPKTGSNREKHLLNNQEIMRWWSCYLLTLWVEDITVTLFIVLHGHSADNR